MQRPAYVLSFCALLAASQSGFAQQTPPPPREAGAIGALVEAVESGNLGAVRALREAAGPIGVRIATWQILRDGAFGDFATYASFERTHAHWPGMDRVRLRAEARLEGQSAQTVLAWFATRPAQTTQGALLWLAALEETGGDVAPVLRDLWLERTLSAQTEADLLARHGDVLRPMLEERLDAMTWQGEIAAAERLYPMVSAGARAVAQARFALQNRADGVDAMIAALPRARQSDPGLNYDRFIWRLRRGRTDEAAELMRAVSPDGLGQPERWAGQRARLARRAMSEGAFAAAYEMAANHGLSDGVAVADLEWLAGYIALRHLNRPEAALGHFQRLRARVSSPISLGRAGYWEGRAQEAMGQEDAARAAYEFGAQHQTAYYGQLAAERLGRDLDPALIDAPSYPDWRETSLASSDLFEAAELLYRAGQWYEARRFTLHLARQLTNESELGALAQFWLERGEPHFALKIAKIAIGTGVVLPHAYFPRADLSGATLHVSEDLALAIARRESEFNFRAVSPADARGLMQVLPATGAHVAGRLGLTFSEPRLNNDPAYNATLGSGYLQELMGQFDDTLSLVAAGYNAGPGRPRRWVNEFGDPRQQGVDPIDWVEMIPFNETRNYVMRVTEAVVIYRARLAGRAGPIGLTRMLRGR